MMYRIPVPEAGFRVAGSTVWFAGWDEVGAINAETGAFTFTSEAADVRFLAATPSFMLINMAGSFAAVDMAGRIFGSSQSSVGTDVRYVATLDDERVMVFYPGDLYFLGDRAGNVSVASFDGVAVTVTPLESTRYGSPYLSLYVAEMADGTDRLVDLRSGEMVGLPEGAGADVEFFRGVDGAVWALEAGAASRLWRLSGSRWMGPAVVEGLHTYLVFGAGGLVGLVGDMSEPLMAIYEIRENTLVLRNRVQSPQEYVGWGDFHVLANGDLAGSVGSAFVIIDSQTAVGRVIPVPGVPVDRGHLHPWVYDSSANVAWVAYGADLDEGETWGGVYVIDFNTGLVAQVDHGGGRVWDVAGTDDSGRYFVVSSDPDSHWLSALTCRPA
ncbi:MAG: hypothetical protein QY307_02770 [Acidimicrobiia bacterium]|nr:MAG: hypothetical protein QY307_02770 [Acidimicrobiia bacterium]